MRSSREGLDINRRFKRLERLAEEEGKHRREAAAAAERRRSGGGYRGRTTSSGLEVRAE